MQFELQPFAQAAAKLHFRALRINVASVRRWRHRRRAECNNGYIVTAQAKIAELEGCREKKAHDFFAAKINFIRGDGAGRAPLTITYAAFR